MTKGPKKRRLDLHLLTKGLVSTRQKAQNLIRAGKVRDINGQLLDKPGQEVSVDLELKVAATPRFVSRGGEKLLAALDFFPLKIEGKVCIDGGISTGGFTDCLLQHGAKRVYGIDVGYGQTAWSIRQDSRVVLKERTNLRTLTSEDLYRSCDPLPSFAVADLSFISLRLILPSLMALLHKENPEAILLVKPQFEVGRDLVGKGGVVREVSAHIYALKSVVDSVIKNNFVPKGLIASPLTGAAGNHEYLLWLGLNGSQHFPSIENVVRNTLLP